MRRIVLLALLCCIQCSSLYMRNRGRDAMDVFTLEVETQSYGASVRAGPVKAGLQYKSADGFEAGLRGGDLGVHHGSEFTILFFGADWFQKAAPPETAESAAALPSESPSETAPAETEAPGPSSAQTPAPEIAADADSASTDPPLTTLRDKEFRARSPFGTTVPLYKKRSVFKKKGGFAPATYYTQVEVTVGLYFGIKVGFNPGELIDALLGWTTFDLFGDDEPFESPQEKAFKENPLYNKLTDEQKAKFREQMGK